MFSPKKWIQNVLEYLFLLLVKIYKIVEYNLIIRVRIWTIQMSERCNENKTWIIYVNNFFRLLNIISLVQQPSLNSTVSTWSINVTILQDRSDLSFPSNAQKILDSEIHQPKPHRSAYLAISITVAPPFVTVVKSKPRNAVDRGKKEWKFFQAELARLRVSTDVVPYRE